MPCYIMCHRYDAAAASAADHDDDDGEVVKSHVRLRSAREIGVGRLFLSNRIG